MSFIPCSRLNDFRILMSKFLYILIYNILEFFEINNNKKMNDINFLNSVKW